MEPAQKRQRTAATTMQRINVLPKEVQVSILMFAMEPTPTARIMKAAIDKASSYPNDEPCWWKKGAVSKDRGYQKYLNRYTHCHRLWARVLAVREEGEEDDTIYWKWSETNVREQNWPRLCERRVVRLGNRDEHQARLLFLQSSL